MRDFHELSDQDLRELIDDVNSRVVPEKHRDAQDLSMLFREAASRKLPVKSTILASWISCSRPESWSQPGIEAMTVAEVTRNQDPLVLEALRAALSSEVIKVAVMAVRVLGAFQDKDSIDTILAILDAVAHSEKHKSAFMFTVVSLERIGEPRVAPYLQNLIPTAPGWQLYWLARVISRLTGYEPLPPKIDWQVDPSGYEKEWRQQWGSIDLSQPATPHVEYSELTKAIADVEVTNGKDLFSLRPEYPGTQSNWPQWGFSWCHCGEPIYETGSGCWTCEMILLRMGWAPTEAVRLAQAVRNEVIHVEGLNPALLKALEPLMACLATGRYQVRIVDLPLEAATFDQTWYYVDSDDSLNLESNDVFYQMPYVGDPLPFVVAPTQPRDVIDPHTVEKYADEIKQGHRPAVIAAAYSARRYDIHTDEYRTSVTGFIIDGHHKMAAYTRLGTPTRTIFICDQTPRQPSMMEDPLVIFSELLTPADGKGGPTKPIIDRSGQW